MLNFYKASKKDMPLNQWIFFNSLKKFRVIEMSGKVGIKSFEGGGPNFTMKEGEDQFFLKTAI
jgi:hypothetical protein